MTVGTEAAPAKHTRVTKRRAETRSRLLDAAYRVFADKGFGRTRIEDVCAAAGYTRGAFYSQFDSLDAMFFTLYEQKARVITEQVADAITHASGGISYESTLDRVAETLLLERDWLLIKTDFLMHAARHPDVASLLMEHRHQLRTAIEQRLAEVDSPLPPPLTTPSDAARAAIAVYDGVTVQLLLDDDLAAAREWLRQLLAVFLGASG
ncbi:TetR family transcriptional regulator [Mycolicibacterium sp. BiH015]|uniref:TetR/AcrR family transcriptional regulator n=1 Tax=Mycolicibacterium sp. BiH015 TaxID=3018808 RepID=UPI0022E20099|nr:TetR family transcriptional regulator [Mycolicibacterium sp. BiH015]MDA2893352.1 TetR family transcriptional regulator [Mycolicibacterium sp. BiH015]